MGRDEFLAALKFAEDVNRAFKQAFQQDSPRRESEQEVMDILTLIPDLQPGESRDIYVRGGNVLSPGTLFSTPRYSVDRSPDGRVTNIYVRNTGLFSPGKMFLTPTYTIVNNQKKDGVCYVTTAAVEHMGLPDDHEDLETLRGLRAIMEETPEGRKLVQEYEERAPVLVERVRAHPLSNQILDWSFEQVQLAAELTRRGKYDEAVAHYKSTVHRLDSMTQ